VNNDPNCDLEPWLGVESTCPWHYKVAHFDIKLGEQVKSLVDLCCPFKIIYC